MGKQSKAKAKRRLLAAYRAKWEPIGAATHPSWRWLVQLVAWWDLQRQAKGPL